MKNQDSRPTPELTGRGEQHSIYAEGSMMKSTQSALRLNELLGRAFRGIYNLLGQKVLPFAL
jgi:hypothetical protein